MASHKSTHHEELLDAPTVPPSEGLHDFRFTFNCSNSTFGGNSFIEPDPFDREYDSESLSESVQNFPEEFGRTYHAYKAGSYAFPNDMPEIDRLNLQNCAIEKICGGRLYLAPLSKSAPPRAILDIATGTGDWAVKMGDEFPQAEIIGTDLSPIQPRCVPPNVNFYVEDSSQPWEYSHKFDYIHTRVTAGCWLSFKDEIAQQAFDNLQPGGYFESQEYDALFRCDDGTLTEDSPLSKWSNDLVAAGEAMGRPVATIDHIKEAFEQVGFVDVQQRVYKMPLNPWPKDERLKELGSMWQTNWHQGISGFSYAPFNRVFGRTAEQTEVSLVDVRRDICNTQIHAYSPIVIVWGRKPFPGEGPIPPVRLG